MEHKKFIKLTERNDWEGETWNFYIPIRGNEEAIAFLKEALDPNYSIGENEFTEHEVDILCNSNDNWGYMPKHNKYDFVIDFNKLKNAEIETVGDLMELSRENVKNIPSLGDKGINVIYQQLQKFLFMKLSGKDVEEVDKLMGN